MSDFEIKRVSDLLRMKIGRLELVSSLFGIEDFSKSRAAIGFVLE
ncbi:hypothetical protein [Streptococcus sp. 121]|nr:hypothetical protein [Streptococcus sp. 121]